MRHGGSHRNPPRSNSKPRSPEKSEVNFSEPDGVNYLADELSSLKPKQNSEGKGDEIAAGDDDDDGKTNEDIVLTILNDLQSSVCEPELTEEQQKLNDDSQDDELLALRSIYDENMFIFDRHKDMRYFQLHVSVDATSEYTVSAILNLNADPSQDSQEDYLYSFKAQHLPPIVLSCLLPKTYPSHLPPYFSLSVQWMNPDTVTRLCSMLDSIWMKQPRQEVLYQWTDWLQNSSLSHIGFGNEIVLGPYGAAVTCSRDKRAVSGSCSLIQIFLISRVMTKENAVIASSRDLHECSICFSEYPGILKSVFSDEAYESWETLMIQKTLESMTGIAYCPRCGTQCIEDEQQLALCSKCYFSFCTLCNGKRHVGVACMSPELKLQILQERQGSSLLGVEQRRKEKEMINEIMSVKVITESAKQCPSCNIAISKTGGCNKMHCNNCGHYFCYRCNESIINGYAHYSEGTRELFPQEAIQEWNERMNERQVIGQDQARLYPQRGQFPQRGHVCPNCRQFNAKQVTQ